MEENKSYCEGCDEYVIKVSVEHRDYKLCDSCNEKYEDKSGYCSLYCSLGNGCDGTC